MIDIIIRPENKSDYNAVFNIYENAFNRNDESQIYSRLKKNPVAEEFSLIADVEGKIAGNIIFLPAKIVKKKICLSVINLALIAVLPEFQKSGIGTLLVESGLSAAQRAGYPATVVLGDEKFYSKFGFSSGELRNFQPPKNSSSGIFMFNEFIQGSLNNVRSGKFIPFPLR